MHTQLADWIRDTDDGRKAEAVIGRCTHCGFCLPACPTFQLTGDELDSPRGRIYQMKLMLEGIPPTAETRLHLDRCLTCHACETACPSGVQYGQLVDIGRRVIAQRNKRPLGERVKRAMLRFAVLGRWFGSFYRLGRLARPLLPATLGGKITPARPAGPLPRAPGRHARQVVMLANCVQPAMLPSIDAATQRVLDALNIGTRYATGSACCGAINFHLDEQATAREQMRANIDAWLPLLDSGEVEAVVVNASGCGAMIKDYARHLRLDPAYAGRAARLMPRIKDIAEFLAPMAGELRARMHGSPGRCALHAPCTLEHWLGLRATTERLLHDLGFELPAFDESHMCCGSAGTWSLMQPGMSGALRERKLAAIHATGADVIVSANIGCITHLQAGTDKPVLHWIEVVDKLLIE